MTADDLPGGRLPASTSEDAVVQRFTWTETPPALAVVRVISAVLNEQPTEFEPLHGSVDADALGTLVLSSDDVSVSFRHLGLAITVRGDGTVVADPE